MRGLKADRIEHAATTPAAPRLLLRLTNNLAAKSLTTQRFGKEENVDEQKAERSATKKARNHLIRVGVGYAARTTFRMPSDLIRLEYTVKLLDGFSQSRG